MQCVLFSAAIMDTQIVTAVQSPTVKVLTLQKGEARWQNKVKVEIGTSNTITK
jgi:hypothetical protein